MSDRPTPAATIPVGSGDLEMAQDGIQMAQQDLDRLLEQMKQALDDGHTIEPKLFEGAAEQAREMEIEASSLQKDLEKREAHSNHRPTDGARLLRGGVWQGSPPMTAR